MSTKLWTVLALITVLIAFGTASAKADDVLVLAKNIDHVENPRELQLLWKDVINQPIIKTRSAANAPCIKR